MIQTPPPMMVEPTVNRSSSTVSPSLLSIHKEFACVKKVTTQHHPSQADTSPSSQPSSKVTKRKQPQSKKRKEPPCSSNATIGRWTTAEHDAFLRGLSLYGREWKRVAADIPSRTSAQVRSHAQKYFAKLSRFEQQQHTAMAPSSETAATLVVDSTSFPDMTESVRRQAERIVADPGSVEAEVRNTLQKLRQEYAHLQRRLAGISTGSTTTTAAEATDEELIALDVLRGGLKKPHNSP